MNNTWVREREKEGGIKSEERTDEEQRVKGRWMERGGREERRGGGEKKAFPNL